MCQRQYGSQLVYLYVCNSYFSKVVKTKCWRMQYRHSATIILNVIVLDFLNKGFVHYLWHDLLTSNAVVVHSRLPRRQICLQVSFNLKLEYSGTSIIGPQLTGPSIIPTPQGCNFVCEYHYNLQAGGVRGSSIDC